MKKIYSFLLLSTLSIPLFIYCMPEQREIPIAQEAQKPLQKKWWYVRSWSKNQKIAAGTLIATALALFGSYEGIIAHMKPKIKMNIKNNILNVNNYFTDPLFKEYATTYANIPGGPRKEKYLNLMVDRIIALMPMSDIAFEAIAYPIRRFNPQFPW